MSGKTKTPLPTPESSRLVENPPPDATFFLTTSHYTGEQSSGNQGTGAGVDKGIPSTPPPGEPFEKSLTTSHYTGNQFGGKQGGQSSGGSQGNADKGSKKP